MGLDVGLVGGDAVDEWKVDAEGSASGSSYSSEADAGDGWKVDEEGSASGSSYSSEEDAGDEGGNWGDEARGGEEEA